MSFNPYIARKPLDDRIHATIRATPAARTFGATLSLPFVEVPPRGRISTHDQAQYHFRPDRFVLYADDATKLRVQLLLGVNIGGGAVSSTEMPAAIFADGPAVDLAPLVLHCSECGAPTKEGEPKCRHCGAPFTWRLTESAFGMVGLKLEWRAIQPGVTVRATFSNRSDKPIGVDCAFIGEAIDAFMGGDF